MTFARLRLSGYLLALAVALAACGPRAAGPAPDPGAGLPIQIEHNLDLATSVTLFVVDPGGMEHRLGTVAPGQIDTFTFQATTRAGNFHLVAEGPPGYRIFSRPFTMLSGGVRWDLLGNNVTPLRAP